MDNLKIYQICHNLITYFATLISPKKSHLSLIFRTGGSNLFYFMQNLINNRNKKHLGSWKIEGQHRGITGEAVDIPCPNIIISYFIGFD